MEFSFLMNSLLIFLFLTQTCSGDVLFTSLPRTLVVTASPQQGQVIKAGEDRITVKWGLNETLHSSEADKLYKNVKLTLCFAPISQIDRGWRRTSNDLNKDKTCQFTITERPYEASRVSQSFEWMVGKDVPTATFFVRAYARDSAGQEVAFGQTTDSDKRTNMFEIQGSSGRHASLQIASVCFSVFSALSLVGVFLVERKKNKSLSSK